MANVNPSMRLKVNRDTLYIPDPSGGVYFRNNGSSFKMEGSTISQWIEKLMPLFNGERSLDELTRGLTADYRERVFEIAGILYQNGYIRDVSVDRPHRLTKQVLSRYGSQIEFLDVFGGSGGARFEEYRQSRVLAVGAGPLFISLVSSLLESGLPRFHYVITDSVPTDRRRMSEVVYEAGRYDAETAVEELTFEDWRSAVQPFDAILYVSEEGNTEGLKALHEICREEGKILIPALFLAQSGMAGPILYPGREGDLESALRTLHAAKGNIEASRSSTASAMLANLIVFEWLKEVTGVKEAEQNRQFYLLNLETLEGSWQSFWNQTSDAENDRNEANLFDYFSRITNPETGIFYRWEEGSLEQLPLAQCCVQPVGPHSGGLLPEIICTGLTHEEARREAGLAGIEAYAAQLAGNDLGIGAGETRDEGICRGLEKALAKELVKDHQRQAPVYPAALREVTDEHCRYYLQVLKTFGREPVIALGRKVNGFPVVWAGQDGSWSRSTGLNLTLAVRKALQQAVEKVQNGYEESGLAQPVLLENSIPLSIPSWGEADTNEVLYHAEQILAEEGQKLAISDLTPDPIFKKGLAGIYGVALTGEGRK
ncbi:putative thiazole-containing bacteriocin maturation protein [Metabacillus sp. RGM 3146]|uniref:putative thiazole-containing bacteriocin maturation protein n=1 Tax=Metabacillus sp. RGM 3146 TaxID=3401092 RepID=UPI003B999726